MPAIGMFEEFDEFYRRQIAQAGDRFELEAIGGNAIDAPLIGTRAGVHVFQDLRRQERCPFDQFAVHVKHIQRAVGGVRKLHGPEPVVG